MTNPIPSTSFPVPTLSVDSQEYEVLYHAALNSAACGGLSCEIGIRAGGSTELIMAASIQHRPSRPHIAIDPWGNLPYKHGYNVTERPGYDDHMRRQAMYGLYAYADVAHADMLVLPWTDIDFFERCKDGVPLYLQSFPEQHLWNEYSFVHFDGPHDVPTVLREIVFFRDRMLPGSYWVFDDIIDYPHVEEIEPIILSSGFVRTDTPFTDFKRAGLRKASYVKPK